MPVLTLAYHDIVCPGSTSESGFPGPDAATYKVPLRLFREHLQALKRVQESSPYRMLLTFDDGGSSASQEAECLEQVGEHGHFFITTDFIGKPGFLSAAQIADLHSRGHVIGSHGATHRGKMNRLPYATLMHEWSESVKALAAIIGARVDAAAVPSGYYSPLVAHAAARAGIRRVFTQRPTIHSTEAFGCEVCGRFTIRSWTTTSHIEALARGRLLARVEDAAMWRLWQAAKSISGSAYGNLRRAFFASRSGVV